MKNKRNSITTVREIERGHKEIQELAETVTSGCTITLSAAEAKAVSKGLLVVNASGTAVLTETDRAAVAAVRARIGRAQPKWPA